MMIGWDAGESMAKKVKGLKYKESIKYKDSIHRNSSMHKNSIKIFLIVLGSMLLTVFLSANVIILISNIDDTKYTLMPSPDPGTRLLVVASHQDDETLIAGDYMIKTMEDGGEVFVIYTVDGATKNDSVGYYEAKDISNTRKLEVKAALGLIGVDEDHIIFFDNENRKALMETRFLDWTIDALGTHIRDIDPDVIFIPAYEGSHCDHDMTNFAVMTALDRYGIDDILVYEAPEYNSFGTAWDYVLLYAGKISLFHLKDIPEFADHPSAELFRLDVSPQDLSLKHSMLASYVSQDVSSLMISHGGPDTFRIAPAHNYSLPPYKYKDTFKYKFCVWRGKSDCDYFNICRVSFDEMHRVMETIDRSDRSLDG